MNGHSGSVTMRWYRKPYATCVPSGETSMSYGPFQLRLFIAVLISVSTSPVRARRKSWRSFAATMTPSSDCETPV